MSKLFSLEKLPYILGSLTGGILFGIIQVNAIFETSGWVKAKEIKEQYHINLVYGIIFGIIVASTIDYLIKIQAKEPKTSLDKVLKNLNLISYLGFIFTGLILGSFFMTYRLNQLGNIKKYVSSNFYINLFLGIFIGSSLALIYIYRKKAESELSTKLKSYLFLPVIGLFVGAIVMSLLFNQLDWLSPKELVSTRTIKRYLYTLLFGGIVGLIATIIIFNRIKEPELEKKSEVTETKILRPGEVPKFQYEIKEDQTPGCPNIKYVKSDIYYCYDQKKTNEQKEQKIQLKRECYVGPMALLINFIKKQVQFGDQCFTTNQTRKLLNEIENQEIMNYQIALVSRLVNAPESPPEELLQEIRLFYKLMNFNKERAETVVPDDIKKNRDGKTELDRFREMLNQLSDDKKNLLNRVSTRENI